MGYELTCKICSCHINIGDEVESKAGGLRPKGDETDRGRKRTPKFYHGECYDDFHLDFDHEGKPLSGSGEALLPEGEDEKDKS
jgi:hypothetical protein